MSEKERASSTEVENALKDLIKMAVPFDVNSDGFIYNFKNGELQTLEMDGGVKAPICIYKENLPDANTPHFVFNPFQEHLACFEKTNSLFYNIQRTVLYGRFCQVIKLVIRFIQKQNEIDIPEDSALSKVGTHHKELVKVGARNAENGKKLSTLIDDKSFDNIESFLESKDQKVDLIFIGYIKKMSCSALRLNILTDSDYEEVTNLKKMRKQDLMALRAIIMGILNLKKKDDLEEFEVTCKDWKYPSKMYTWLSVLAKVYAQLNPFLKIIDDLYDDTMWSIDLSMLQHHIFNLDRYAATTKWNTTGVSGYGAPVKTIQPITAPPRVEAVGSSHVQSGYIGAPPPPVVAAGPRFRPVGTSEMVQPAQPTPVYSAVPPMPTYPPQNTGYNYGYTAAPPPAMPVVNPAPTYYPTGGNTGWNPPPAPPPVKYQQPVYAPTGTNPF